jgi:hypothetical protein
MTRSGRKASQQPNELAAFIEIIKHSDAYLEIGARHGDTFYEVMRSLPKGSKGVAVDMPNGPWGGNSRHALLDCCEELTNLGYNVTLIFGDSAAVAGKVRELGPFDAVLIDADHRFEAVKRDFANYGDSPIVAFHDIDGDGLDCGGMPVEVPLFWREIKQQFRHTEIIDPSDDRKMGIGVLFRE